jgi:hypothetical protein
MTKMLSGLLCLVCVACAAFNSASAQPLRDQQVATLARLPGVYVDITLSFPDTKMSALRKEWLLGSIRRILRDRDVPTAQEAEHAVGNAALLVFTVDVREFRKDEFSYVARAELWQPATLTLVPARVRALTWQGTRFGTFGMFSENPVPPALDDLAATFAGDYQSTQPFKREAEKDRATD